MLIFLYVLIDTEYNPHPNFDQDIYLSIDTEKEFIHDRERSTAQLRPRSCPATGDGAVLGAGI
jgi:hypothetical protein